MVICVRTRDGTVYLSYYIMAFIYSSTFLIHLSFLDSITSDYDCVAHPFIFIFSQLKLDRNEELILM